MLGPLLTISISVALGCALALVPDVRQRIGGLIRTFAVAAACSVVLFGLLPHAMHALGPLALLVTGAVFAIIPLVQRLATWWAHRRGGPEVDLGLEAAFVALLAHRVGDGAAMAAADHRSLGVLLALGAHAVPVVAFMVLAFRPRGVSHSLMRAAVLALASAAGVLAVSAIPGLTTDAAAGWVDAIVAGTLLHIVAHELSAEPPPGRSFRALDLLAAAAGIAATVIPEWVGAHGDEDAHAEGWVGAGALLLLLVIVLRDHPSVGVSRWLARIFAPHHGSPGCGCDHCHDPACEPKR